MGRFYIGFTFSRVIYDGDGKADYCAARAGAGSSPMVWWILKSSGGFSATEWAISTDLPVQGDYDGDARTDIAVVREGAATAPTFFYTLNSFDGVTSAVQWGVGADFPVATFDSR